MRRYYARYDSPSSSVTSNPSTTTKTILDDDNQFLIEPSEATPVERVKRSLEPIDMSDQIRKLDKEYEEGTRQWFVNDILKWIECNKSRTLWITGGAGTGKTIVSHLISLTIPTASFGTVFYCSRSDPARSDVSKILKTIAYDLSTKFPMYFKYLLDLVNKDERFVLKGNPSVINSPPLKLAKFLLTGGFKFMEGSTERLVIIIDGIDEIDNTSQRNDLLAIIKNAAFNLPSFVRLIVAGRLMNELWDQLSQVDIRVLEPTSDRNMADLRTFIRPRLDDMGIYIPDDLDKATDELARKVNGVFGYAKNALESMQLENLHDIEDLLMSINSLTPDLCQTCDFSELQRVISTVTAIRIPLSLSGVLQLLDLPKPHAARIVSVLMKLFRTENSAIIERYFSIISGLDASFEVNLEDVEARLADFCFRVLLAELRFNMANIHESYQYNFHNYIPNFNMKVSSIPEHIRYAATYTTVHIESAMKRTIPDHYATQLNSTISSILSTKLTYWIELHSLTGSGSSAVEVMFRQILSFIETYTGTISVDAKSKSLVENALLIVERFYTPISSCAFQVYWTVLPFSATDSVFREMYWESRPIGKYPKLLKDVEYSKLENFSAAQTLTGHTDWVWPVGIIDLNQRRRILTGSGDKTVKIWEASTGKLVQTLTGHNNMVYSIAVSVDGQRIISGSSAGHIKMWRSSDGNLLQDLNGHTNAVYSLVFSKDGSCFVSGSSDKSIIVWDSNRGTTMKVLLGHTNCVASVAISNDGRRIASGSWDKTIKIWDMKSGAELRTLSGHTNMVWSVQFLNDGVRLVSASEDTTIKIWNLDSGVELRTLTGHTGCVRSVALSSGGHRIVSGSYDQTVRIWDLEAGKLIRTLTGHSKFVLGVVISDDGLQIVSGSQDNTAKIWNLELTQSMLMEEMDDVGDYSKLWANNGLNSKKGKAVTANLQNSNKYLLNAEGWICSDDIKLFWLPFKATGEIMWVSKGRLAIRFESKALIIDISDFDSPPVNSDATLRNDSTLNHFRTSSYNSYVEIPYPKVSSPTSVSNEPSTPIVSSSATSSDERARQMDKNSDKKKIFKFF
ncbi:POC1 centriolar protein A [Nowakowskiella sp. JEL0407]|nr:POC1 centriolar protein A [Nowakowskiella sp. JEL0407]